MFDMSYLFEGVYYNPEISSGVGYKYGRYEPGNPSVSSVSLESLVSPEGMEYLDRAINAAPEAEADDVMKRVGEYVIEVFPAA